MAELKNLIVNGEDWSGLKNQVDGLNNEIEIIRSDELSHRRLIGEYTNVTVYGVCGVVTTGAKDADLFIPMNWSNNVTSVSISSVTSAMRTTAGGYLGGAINADLTSYISSVTPIFAQGLIFLKLTNSNGWGLTNNTPLCGTLSISYTVA